MGRELTDKEKLALQKMDQAAEIFKAELAGIAAQYPEATMALAGLFQRHTLTAGYKRMATKFMEYA